MTFRINSVIVLLMAAYFMVHVKTENILGIFPVGAKSHFIFGEAIMKSLHAAGHNITIISPFGKNEISNNYTVVTVTCESLQSSTPPSIEEFVNLPLYTYLEAVEHPMRTFCVNFLASEYVQNLLKSPKAQFDVLIMEYLPIDFCFTILAEKMNISVIAASPIQSAVYVDSVLGNPSHPAAVPAGFTYMPRQMNLYQRLENVVYYTYFQILYEIFVVTKFLKLRGEIRENLGYDGAEKKISLVFQNSHSSLLARPLVQNVIEVGGIHVKPSQPLPQEIQKFIDESSAGVILFTFGSIARGTFLSPNIVDAFKEVFSEIPQRVIWKYEETIENLPKNIFLSNWIPQRDVLAHKNVVAFITYCGIAGVYEAINGSVPLIMIPLYGDQLPNAAALKELGVGEYLDALRLTKDKIKEALDLVINKTSYREKMRQLSHRFKDRPMTPQEAVVYWTEYVIAHNGAFHLRTHLADMPTYQFLLIDVIVIIATPLLLTIWLGHLLVRIFFKSSSLQSTGKFKQN